VIVVMVKHGARVIPNDALIAREPAIPSMPRSVS
jgi:hypothetical protein